MAHSHHHSREEEAHPLDIAIDNSVIRDIFYAANVGDLELLRRFVEEEKVDVNIRGDDEVTPLHWAAYKGHFQLVRYLVERKAEIDAPNKSEGHTPLMWAAIGGYIKIVHFLLKSGADAHKVDGRGYNALHHAIQYNQNVVGHYLLNEAGLKIDSTDHEGHTALLWAAYTNHEEAVRYLLSQGANVNAQDNGGSSALHWAAVKGNASVVNALLTVGHANPNLKDKESATPTDAAQKKDQFKVAKILREAQRAGPSPLSEQSLVYLWFFVAFLGIQYFFFVLSNFPNFLVGLVIVFGTFYGLRFLLARLWLDVNHRNPTWVGVVMSAYFLSVYVYFSNIYWIPNIPSGESMVFFVMNCIFFPLYIKLLRGDPGSVRAKSSSPENEWRHFVSSLEKDDPLPQFCLSCMVRRPIRGKHCRSCNSCIARFDHHCGWINNCVGVENHFPFLCCLALVITNHLFFLRFCFIALTSLPGAPFVFPANHSIPFYFENEPTIVLLIFFHSINVFWQSWLIFSLLRAVVNNETTNETINGPRYEYLRDPDTGKSKNPFNQSLSFNVKDILNPAIDWYHIYSVPKYLYNTR